MTDNVISDYMYRRYPEKPLDYHVNEIGLTDSQCTCTCVSHIVSCLYVPYYILAHVAIFVVVLQALRKLGHDKLILMLCVTVFLSYLPEAGEYSCFFVYLRLVGALVCRP